MIELLAGTALAQSPADREVPALNAQLFRAAAGAGRWWWVDPAGSVADPRLRAGASLHYTNDPLVYQDPLGERIGLVADVAQLDLTAAGRIGPVQLGVVAPAYLLVQGADGTGAGLGDLAVDARFTALEPAPLGLALAGRLALPTSGVPGLGAPAPSWELSVVAEGAAGPVRVAANLGTTGGRRIDLENVSLGAGATLRAGAAWDVGSGAALTLELAARAPYTAAPSTPGAVAAEWLGGASTEITPAWTLRGGAGTGLTSGIGAPDLRVVTGLAWSPAPPAPVGAPEIEPDRDHDGITNVHDACVDAAEDADDVRDTDGCPEPEVKVSLTLVGPDGQIPPIGSVEVGGAGRSFVGPAASVFELTPGPWQVTGAAAGFVTATSPLEVTGSVSRTLPLAPLPDRRTDTDRDQIALRESIEFASGSATLLPVSAPLLDELAAVLRDTPEITRVAVHGHTDNRGDAAENLALSSARAAAVCQALIERGVAAERMVSRGFGESQPLDPREVEQAWAQNRRVEIRIAELVPIAEGPGSP